MGLLLARDGREPDMPKAVFQQKTAFVFFIFFHNGRQRGNSVWMTVKPLMYQHSDPGLP
jgi:hypothetical protein